MLTWPHLGTDWGPVLDEVEPVWVELADAITAHEALLLVAHDQAVADHARDLLDRRRLPMHRVHIAVVPTDDTWARDHGPITVRRNGTRVPLDFVFNGWGDKFDATRDNAITRILDAQGLFMAPSVPFDLVLEGGSIEVDGNGSLLTTRRCLLNPNRNPALDQAALEAILTRHLGVDQVLWLHHGHLHGDDTDAHIDTLARFAPDRAIVHVACDDPADPHYDDLRAMANELADLRDADGQPYRLHPLPWPAPKRDADGNRLAASYANYLIINDAVLVPTYRDPRDADALAVIAAAHSGRTIVPIDCLSLLQQGGSLHCLTMQIPEGTLNLGA